MKTVRLLPSLEVIKTDRKFLENVILLFLLKCLDFCYPFTKSHEISLLIFIGSWSHSKEYFIE